MVYATRYLRVIDPLMQGPDVLAAQTRLKEMGFKPGPLDGIYGKETEAAVKNLQKEYGLLVDGIVGPETWGVLNYGAMTGQKVKIGQASPQNAYRINIDLTQRKLQLRKGQMLVKGYPVAVGKPSTPSPVGDWTIVLKSMNPGGPFGARWMRLSVPWGGYGIHGTDNPPSIGKAASHGCIRMYNEDVSELYDLVPVGTPVKIIGQVYTGRILSEGVSPGPDVSEVQSYLQVLGFYKGDVDGFFGPQTKQAVTDFQSANGLEPDGVVGPLTYDTLQKAFDIATGNQQP